MVPQILSYLLQIFPVPYCVTMDAVRTGLVAKSKPVAVRVYDYYQPGMLDFTFIFSAHEQSNCFLGNVFCSY